jgi:hypothetical protein
VKKSTKAALLSGLVFPGLGHFVLKQHLRGSILMVASIAALWILVKIAFDRALTIVNQINTGDIPLDTGAIMEAAADSGASPASFAQNVSYLVLVACWLFAIIDSYRLGVVQEKPSNEP